MTDLPDKEHAFLDWFNEVLERANVSDKRYPVKGLNVWTPFGFKALSLMDRLIREKVEPLGYQETAFPTLIPDTEFQKEGKHIKGFEEEVYWVTLGGKTPLDVRLALRPTSETAIYPMFSLWVRSHKDLPLRVYQICNVFRYETKTTRPILRVREIHFFEGHTVQLGEAEAEAQVQADLGSFLAIADALCLPYIKNKRPEWDKFAGAFYSVACDLPIGGNRTLQIGTVHHYKDNFAKAFNICYEDKDGEQKFGHQTTYGISERLLGAVIAMHGDDHGLVWPSIIAPVQVVIIPIARESDARSVNDFAQDVQRKLMAEGLRVALDASDERPGAKYYAWEMKGVPLRIEIGPREIKDNKLSAVNRLGERSKIPGEDLMAGVAEALEAFDASLRKRADSAFQERITIAREEDELKDDVVSLVGWCGSEECGKKAEKGGDRSIIGTVMGELPIDAKGMARPSCIFCGNDSSAWAVVSRPL
jgi:prolyl-tRNA synthetase